ncbi:MAG: bacteriohemerythrin [Acidobacteriota bacterium]
MPLINWDDRFSVGIQRLDQHHKAMVAMVNELHDAMKAGQGQKVVGEIVQRLVNYTRNHFAAEEQLFDLYAYPDAEKHREEHASLVAKVEQWRRDLAAGRKAITLEVANSLREWLLHHILESDKKYGPYLNSKGVI